MQLLKRVRHELYVARSIGFVRMRMRRLDVGSDGNYGKVTCESGLSWVLLPSTDYSASSRAIICGNTRVLKDFSLEGRATLRI